MSRQFPARVRGEPAGRGIEGEDSVNIIAQGTAVPTLVEVRDRNDLPVSGASVLFLLGEGGTATLNAGLQPGRDAQAMERFPDTVDHAEHRQRYLDLGALLPVHF